MIPIYIFGVLLCIAVTQDGSFNLVVDYDFLAFYCMLGLHTDGSFDLVVDCVDMKEAPGDV